MASENAEDRDPYAKAARLTLDISEERVECLHQMGLN